MSRTDHARRSRILTDEKPRRTRKPARRQSTNRQAVMAELRALPYLP